mmetsp:Transcript_23813/g.93619  ORF Transcript_23813/g.93619 Transcript_23813/m.93619 type:complete len:85 (-) Transcript_23813:221-475(-)
MSKLFPDVFGDTPFGSSVGTLLIAQYSRLDCSLGLIKAHQFQDATLMPRSRNRRKRSSTVECARLTEIGPVRPADLNCVSMRKT